MPLWRLIPYATPRDPRWLDHPIWQEVIIAAPSAAEARLLARSLELEPATATSNPRQARRSGFEDEKLYRVEELAVATAGEARGVVAAKRLRLPSPLPGGSTA